MIAALFALAYAADSTCTASILVPAEEFASETYFATGSTEDEALGLAWDQACASLDRGLESCNTRGTEGFTSYVQLDDPSDQDGRYFEATLILDPIPLQYDATVTGKRTRKACRDAYELACEKAGFASDCVREGEASTAVLQSEEGSEVIEQRPTIDATIAAVAAADEM